MWKKRFMVVVSGLAISVVLAGCSAEETIVYQDEEMSITDAEEKIADELEIENPGLDLDVSIMEETD